MHREKECVLYMYYEYYAYYYNYYFCEIRLYRVT